MRDEGIFIVIDGIDGAGKTTQVNRFRELFEDAGEIVVCSKEPTQGPWGQKLRDSATAGRLPLDEELALFVRDREQHVSEVIAPALEQGHVVIVDRYFYSTVAYQGVREASVDHLLAEMRSKFPVPDTTFFLDLPAPIAMHRISSERGDQPNEFERVDVLSEIRKVFNTIALQCDEVHVVDSTSSIDFVSFELAKILTSTVLRTKRCAKDYDCEELDRSFRQTGQCQWEQIRRVFRAVAPS